MKKLILLLLFIPLVSFGQISISELIKVAKMDRESFEIYALENGYSYSNSNKKVEDEMEYLRMDKGSGSNYKLLEHYTKFGSSSYASNYTGPQEGLVNIYKELKNLGFTLDVAKELFVSEERYYLKSYIKNDELVDIYITTDGYDLSIYYAEY